MNKCRALRRGCTCTAVLDDTSLVLSNVWMPFGSFPNYVPEYWPTVGDSWNSENDKEMVSIYVSTLILYYSLELQRLNSPLSLTDRSKVGQLLFLLFYQDNKWAISSCCHRPLLLSHSFCMQYASFATLFLIVTHMSRAEIGTWS